MDRAWRPALVVICLAAVAVLVAAPLAGWHAGYEARIQLLTPETLRSPQYAGAAVLIAPTIGAYPFGIGEVEGLGRLPPIHAMPGGLLAVRRPDHPGGEGARGDHRSSRHDHNR